MDPVRQIVRAVLYEGYLLWPYRASALKNRQRWTFGGVYPEPYGRARGGDDPWLTQTQCLVQASPDATVDVQICFLHLALRSVLKVRQLRRGVDTVRASALEPMPRLDVDGERHLAREEATERAVAVCGLRLSDLVERAHLLEIGTPAGQDVKWLTDRSRQRVGAVVRSWKALRGRVEITADRMSQEIFRVTVRLTNTTPWRGEPREESLKRAFVSAHTVLRTDGPGFVSLMDPPDQLRPIAQECRNIGLWPVLVGEEGERHTMLASPIILYDHPQIAPESPGDLFDATEIDQMLRLSVRSLTDEERQEIRGGDPLAREILDQSDGLTSEQLMRLHGVLRPVSPSQGRTEK